MPSGGGNGSGTNDLLPPLMPPPGGENLPVLPVTPSGGGDNSTPPTSTTKTTPNADEENTSSLGENTSAGDLVEENITSTVGENTSTGIFVGTTNIPVVANTSTGGGSSSNSVIQNNCHRYNQTVNVKYNTENDSVVAKEEERSASTVQPSSNGKRKDISITSNVHLLQEVLEENMEERKKSEPSIKLHDHDGTNSPQLVSSKWTKRSQELWLSKNGNFVHARKKQKQNYPYKDFMPRLSSFMNVDPPTKFIHHQNSFVINQIEKFQKIVEYASHRIQEETLGLQE